MTLSVATRERFLTGDFTLPEESALVVPGLEWNDYCKLLDEIGESRGYRLTFAGGTLEIMTLSFRHERLKSLLTTIVTRLCEELNQPVVPAGSTTLLSKVTQRGTEPDAAFYIRQAALVQHSETLDLDHDPAPDLAIEIDLTHSSLDKLPVYSALGISEVWIHDGNKITVYNQINGQFETDNHSLSFSGLTSEILGVWLQTGLLNGQNEMLQQLRRWVTSRQ